MARPLAHSFGQIRVWDKQATATHLHDIYTLYIKEYTKCHFGGFRAWFSCPECKRRVGVLYFGHRGAKCRHCYKVTYASKNVYRHSYAWKVRYGLYLAEKARKEGLRVRKSVRKGQYTRQACKALRTLEKSRKIAVSLGAQYENAGEIMTLF